jgi:hypothetical protein
LAAAAVVVVAACQPPPAAGWTGTGGMSTRRADHAASLLSSGRVLVTGGTNGSGALRSAERYDPATGGWGAAAQMGAARSGHTSTALANGRVLVAGGASGPSAEVYNPSTNTWSPTGTMRQSRMGHLAARLSTGKVLVAGGNGGAEVYDPATNAWTATGPLPSSAGAPEDTEDTEYVTRDWGVDGLVALSNGRAFAVVSWDVIVLPDCPGSVCSYGYVATDVMQYTASTNSWTSLPDMPDPLADTASTLLVNNRILVSGGRPGRGYGDESATGAAQVYDPALREWSSRSGMHDDRVRHTATLLADDRVLVAGGNGLCCEDGGPRSSSEAYDPTKLGFTSLPSMATAREGHVAVRLGDGRVLVAGGTTPGGVTASAEVFRP